MADIRIKDLTTLAPSAVSDDYLAIDGTTNGTRKLSAYSPSFGGNATVGGTLTVSGQANYSNGPLQMSNGREFQFQWGSSTLTLRDNTAGNNPFTANGSTSTFTIGYTTASNNTSSGALVVGNGTSGGLGVGGAIFAGGNIQCNAVFAANSTTLLLRPNGASVSSGQLSVETSGNTTISATTASTGTSSGALVVSGGVGVAGAIYVGGAVDITGQLNLNSGSAAAPSLKLNATNNGLFYNGSNIVRVSAGGSEVASFGTNATITGSLTTGAPSGGTAAAWKLGAVATVSPTSPNRTIEVDIGGTIYYIHAKTTNN